MCRRSRKFKFRGGRAGMIQVNEGDAVGEMEWEMLVLDVDLVIYAEGCTWLVPTSGKMTRSDVLRLAREFADEARFRVEVAFSDGSEVIAPSS